MNVIGRPDDQRVESVFRRGLIFPARVCFPHVLYNVDIILYRIRKQPVGGGGHSHICPVYIYIYIGWETHLGNTPSK